MHTDPHTHLILANQRISAASTTVRRHPSTASTGVLRSLRRAVAGLATVGASRRHARRTTAPAPARCGPAILAE
jgi:hypothetical protein